jgi:hypothetical protein
MTIIALILAILIIGLITKGDKRNAVLIFIGPALLFQVAWAIGIIPSDYFHLIACYFDAAVIGMLVKWSRPGFTPVLLGLVSVGSVFANAGGWMAYEKGLDPLVYDGIYVAVYSLVLVVSLMEWSSGARADCHDMRFRSGWI